jgi:uncharacterized glyoxalase superfamily protein PhnB
MERRGAAVSLQLAVADLDITEAFYGGILELPIERAITARGAPEHLTLNVSGGEVIFVDVDALLSVHPILEDRLTSYPKGVGITIHIQVKAIEEIYEAILEEELEILYPLDVKPYGMKDLWCFDPDGYLLVLEESRR